MATWSFILPTWRKFHPQGKASTEAKFEGDDFNLRYIDSSIETSKAIHRLLQYWVSLDAINANLWRNFQTIPIKTTTVYIWGEILMIKFYWFNDEDREAGMTLQDWINFALRWLRRSKIFLCMYEEIFRLIFLRYIFLHEAPESINFLL